MTQGVSRVIRSRPTRRLDARESFRRRSFSRSGQIKCHFGNARFGPRQCPLVKCSPEPTVFSVQGSRFERPGQGDTRLALCAYVRQSGNPQSDGCRPSPYPRTQDVRRTLFTEEPFSVHRQFTRISLETRRIGAIACWGSCCESRQSRAQTKTRGA
jgi:hypothetical protein